MHLALFGGIIKRATAEMAGGQSEQTHALLLLTHVIMAIVITLSIVYDRALSRIAIGEALQEDEEH